MLSREAGFWEGGGGGQLIRSPRQGGFRGGGLAFVPMLKSLHRWPKEGWRQTPWTPPPDPLLMLYINSTFKCVLSNTLISVGIIPN